ncbi:pyruvate phosphate dikinase [Paenibacillus sp. P1XP2]|nr:pyruvate phosphate dikinase [Paenibacillus sp. P1XP2]
MRNGRCQNNCCQSGSCSMSSFMEAIYPVDRQNDGMSLQDEGQARACSLPEIASLVELVRIESMTKEEAIRAADPYSIGSLLREAEPFSGDQGDLGAPELLLGWCDDARGMGIFAEDWTYPPEQAEALSGTAGLTLLREDDWLARGHLKEIYEEWIMQYAGLSGRPHPSIACRERLLYRWKGHMETVLHHLDERVLRVALISGLDIMKGHPREKEALSDLRDIQLEALFRAALACHRQGMEHRIEILVPHTSDPEAWNQTHELIERVAEETLCHQRRAVSFSIGALMNADIACSAAADLARSANLLVLDCGGISDPETPWPDDVVEHIAALSGTIRKIRPRLLLRATGLRNTADLPAVYRAGFAEIGVPAEQLPAFRLAAAQWEIQQRAGRSSSSQSTMRVKG